MGRGQGRDTGLSEGRDMNVAYNVDCVEAMRQMPDKAFELAIVDPIYGDVKAGGYMTGKSAGGVGPHPKYNYGIWRQKKTGAEYFKELFRVSKNQIVWGGNYFAAEIQKDSPCWIVWDKVNGETKWADCELAWTSFNTAVRKFEYRWSGMLQENMKNKEIRIHPTQKPVALYEWLLTKYATKGDKILDTHVGSASSLIACHNLGFDYVGFELDKDYYDMASKRLEAVKAQVSIFDCGIGR
jgi:site-specific DNA-methyltransferase (adenine-specific)